MRLLGEPSSDFNDISQILRFAQDNLKALEPSTEYYTSDELHEIEKYRDFFEKMKHVAVLVKYQITGAEDHLQKLNDKLNTMIEEAKSRQDAETTFNEDSLFLDEDFINLHRCLLKMVRFMADEVQKNNRMQKTDEIEYLSETRRHNATSDFVSSPVAEIRESQGTSNCEEAQDVLNTDNPSFGYLQGNFTANTGISNTTYERNRRNFPGTARRSNLVSKRHTGADHTNMGFMDESATETKTSEDAAAKEDVVDNTNSNLDDPLHQKECNPVSEEQVFKRKNEDEWEMSCTAGLNCDELNFVDVVTPTVGEDTNALLTNAKTYEIWQKLQQRTTSPLVTQVDLAILNPKTNKSSTKTSNTIQPLGGCSKETGEATSGSLEAIPVSAFGRMNREADLTEGSQLRTLEESLRHFGLFSRLQDLEKSLMLVRRNRSTPKVHQELCKVLDKELQNLSLLYHPDRVKGRNGSEEEQKRAKDLQAALNATRLVLKTLHKMFLEDIDIDHKYSFFTKLDIALLGNEDAVENHVYEVLFKISLVSEIRQSNIIAEIRRFLADGPRCIDRYLNNDFHNFVTYRQYLFSYLKRCVAGYEKLYSELQEVESECRNEKLHNILPTITEMKRDCWHQLKQMEALLQLSKRPFGELLPLYNSEHVDDYYVLPVVSYVKVILACSIMFKFSANENAMCGTSAYSPISYLWQKFGPKRFHGSDTSVVDWYWCGTEPSIGQDSNDEVYPKRLGLHKKPSNFQKESKNVDKVDLLQQLALACGGDKRCKNAIKEKYGWEHMDRVVAEDKFCEVLRDVRADLENKFRIGDYVEGGSNKYILKELKACKEMMEEFRQKAREAAKYIEEMHRNNEYMRKQLDQVQMNQEKVINGLQECRIDSKIFRSRIEELRAERGIE